MDAPFGVAFPSVYLVITFILLYTRAVSFNKMINELRLMQRPNYLAGMGYLLLTSLLQNGMYFHLR